MPSIKTDERVVVKYGGTDYIVKDKGLSFAKRFELINTKTGVVAKRSNNPYDFDEFMLTIWKEMGLM